MAADPYLRLITWEKGFVAEPWDPAQVSGRMVMTRCRNTSTDVRSYHFEFFERPWKKNPQLRQIVVQATTPNGRKIQVAILTGDPERKVEPIIQLMFRRWLQENDFKYLDQHFGINQITSYRCIEYEKLKGQVTDRDCAAALARPWTSVSGWPPGSWPRTYSPRSTPYRPTPVANPPSTN